MRRPIEPLSEAIVSAGFPPSFRCDGCKVPVSRMGPCKRCAEERAEQERAAKRESRIVARIPESYRWATLEPGGTLEKALVSPAPVRAAALWLSGDDSPPFMLIRGKTHQYKSTLAAACARRRLEQGREAFFLFASDLAPLPHTTPAMNGTDPAQVARYQAGYAALRNPRALVVINDIAKILGGADGGSGMAAWRRGDLCSELHRRCEARARTIVTTTLENRIGDCSACRGSPRGCNVCGGTGKNGVPGLVECFGEDIMARLTDERESLMIRLERKRDT